MRKSPIRVSRTKLVAGVATLVVVVLLGSWFSSGWRGASSEAAILRETPVRAAQQELSEVAMALTSRLDRIRSKEDIRPYYHYQNLFHDPRGLSAGESVNPSPLAKETGDSLIEAHFQIDGTGLLSIPSINEELEQFSDQEHLADNKAILRRLRLATNELRGAHELVAAAAGAMEPAGALEPAGAAGEMSQEVQRQAPVQQQNFSNLAFAQNNAPNAVFMELEGRKKSKAGDAEEKRALTDEPVEVLTHGFIWKAAAIGERRELVAIRRVETPSGTLRQGFVIGTEQIATWLAERSDTSMNIALRQTPGSEPGVQSISVPALDSWHLSVDVGPVQALANSNAAGLHSEFLWRFAPTAIVTALLLGLLIVTVSRAERLALERSQFAAAAAHELRTPLAGLQLYGDMLAEGLGDETAKEKYARHISDEAQRLGRVVSNVLGFSQMERKGISLDCRDANLANATSLIVERMRPTLEQAGMNVELAIDEDVFARFDEDALSRILQNLLDNAEKYSRGSESRCVRIAVDSLPQRAVVLVADGGPGLSRGMRQQVFKPYRRNAGADAPAGLGLGLALARSLAQQQGGELRVQDSPLGGVAFALELPLPRSA